MTLSADRVEGLPATASEPQHCHPHPALREARTQPWPGPGFRGGDGERVAEALAAEGP